VADSSRRYVYAALEVLGCSPYALTTGYSRRLIEQGNHEHSVGEVGRVTSHGVVLFAYSPKVG
jgi:hypothetical protein